MTGLHMKHAFNSQSMTVTEKSEFHAKRFVSSLCNSQHYHCFLIYRGLYSNRSNGETDFWSSVISLKNKPDVLYIWSDIKFVDNVTIFTKQRKINDFEIKSPKLCVVIHWPISWVNKMYLFKVCFFQVNLNIYISHPIKDCTTSEHKDGDGAMTSIGCKRVETHQLNPSLQH